MAKTVKQLAQNKSRPERAAESKLAKAYGLLVDQTLSVAGLDEMTRNDIVISAVMDGDRERVLSRYGDLVWEMWPFITTPNIKENQKRLDWACIPEPYREVCKAVVFRYWRVGTEGSIRPGVVGLRKLLINLATFCRFLEAFSIASLGQVHPIHIAHYVHAQKVRDNAARTLAIKFSVLEKLHAFRDQHPEGLRFHPWPESSALEVAGCTGMGFKDARRDGKTPLIPLAVAQALFLHAEAILKTAQAVLDERDAGLRSAWRDPEVTAIRDACFYLLGVLTGMRSSELSSIEVGAGRTEVKNGYTFHWLKSVEHKTKKGLVEFLMPAIGHEILRVLERWSEPHRAKLAVQLVEWELDQEEMTTKRLQRIAAARANRDRLFLGNGGNGVVPLPGPNWGDLLRAFATAAGVEWALAAHQMRRLYAYTFCRHRLGGLQRAGRKVSIKGIAEEAKVTPALIHNRYPDFAEQVRTLTIKSTRAQRDEKRDLLQREREKNRQLRALMDQQIKEFADLASVNEGLRAENSLLNAMADGKVLKGSFGERNDE
jgi:hypothetical protein